MRRHSARFRAPTPTGSNDWRSSSARARLGLRAGDRRADLRERHAEVAIRVDVPDHEGAGFPYDRARLRDPELLGEVGVETGRGLGPVLERELLPFLAHPRGGRRGPLEVVAEIGLEVDRLERRLLGRLGRDLRFGRSRCRLGRGRLGGPRFPLPSVGLAGRRRPPARRPTGRGVLPLPPAPAGRRAPRPPAPPANPSSRPPRGPGSRRSPG